MLIEKVVVNASPLICLSKSGLLHILPSLFNNIVIPDLVFNEVVAKDKIDFKWNKRIFRIISINISPQVLAWDLGNGESSVLSFASSNKQYWAIIDDREARRCATSLRCHFTGTVGIIILAKKRGIIQSLNNSLEKLRNAGLWLSDSFVNDVCKKVGE